MTETNQNDDFGEGSGELIDRLHALAEWIEGQHYPGAAWRGVPERVTTRPGIRRILWPRLAGGAAAAAAVAAAIILLATYSHGPAPVATNLPAQPAQVAVAPLPAEAPRTVTDDLWRLPADINMPPAGDVRMPSADISMPSNLALAVPGRFEWQMPTVSFPTLK
jgi:hypothetical protein